MSFVDKFHVKDGSMLKMNLVSMKHELFYSKCFEDTSDIDTLTFVS